MNTRGCFFKLTAVCTAYLFLSVSVFADNLGEEYNDCHQLGKSDGKDAASGLWLIAGLGCGCIGVGAAYVFTPSPPADRLVGKSYDYIHCYTKAYKSAARASNMIYAAIGWAVWITIYLAVILPSES